MYVFNVKYCMYVDSCTYFLLVMCFLLCCFIVCVSAAGVYVSMESGSGISTAFRVGKNNGGNAKM
jgi:hypothetical protein